MSLLSEAIADAKAARAIALANAKASLEEAFRPKFEKTFNTDTPIYECVYCGSRFREETFQCPNCGGRGTKI